MQVCTLSQGCDPEDGRLAMEIGDDDSRRVALSAFNAILNQPEIRKAIKNFHEVEGRDEEDETSIALNTLLSATAHDSAASEHSTARPQNGNHPRAGRVRPQAAARTSGPSPDACTRLSCPTCHEGTTAGAGRASRVRTGSATASQARSGGGSSARRKWRCSACSSTREASADRCGSHSTGGAAVRQRAACYGRQ
jgi:hypothetical protein